jgi:hypothetical protein
MDATVKEAKAKLAKGDKKGTFVGDVFRYSEATLHSAAFAA